MGLRFFAFGKSRGFFTSAVFCFCSTDRLFFVMLVRKDAHDHAIWTADDLSHRVVTDQHHHRHSFEVVFAETKVTIRRKSWGQS